MTEPPLASLPSLAELESLWAQKYGPVETMGHVPTRRHQFKYYLPADVYEALVSKLVTNGCHWLDVGGGHDIFPENQVLARTLVSRCQRVVAIDPSDNVQTNTFAHQVAQCALEDYAAEEVFDLATMRMVVEHVNRPEAFVQALSGLVKPGGVAVVFTVNLWSPLTIISRFVPFQLHHQIKELFWGGKQEADTFPVVYQMNTRQSLRRLFEASGFSEELFAKRDDLSVFGAFRWLGLVDLLTWRALGSVGLPYPERNLIAVYRKQKSGA